ncbi:MAG: hypothetical protein EOP84_27455 [Verrucomicrobiaceae bacterium]|nr:MAG: hypothetical protein EOP84_27455 [Verrucomicrobiaceae bacterium]
MHEDLTRASNGVVLKRELLKPERRSPALPEATILMIEFIDQESLAEVRNDDSATAHFADKAEESAYERLDSQLIEQIRTVSEALHLSDVSNLRS